MSLKILCATVCFTIPTIALAQEDTIFIVPERIETSAPVQEALSQQKGSTVTSIEGWGSTVAITYHASEPIEIFLAPLLAENRYNLFDFLHFVLPATEKKTAIVQLTGSPGWSPGNRRYLLNILVRSDDVRAGFIDVQFEPASMTTIASAALQHFFSAEPYTPSSFHALHGQRVLGWSGSVMAGVITVLACIVAATASLRRKQHMMTTVMTVLIAALLLYQLRSAMDLLRFSTQHLREFYGKDIYDESGSVHSIARRIRKSAPTLLSTQVFVCRDGTNFKEKLLRYFIYPMPVSADPAVIDDAGMVLVMDKLDSTFVPRENGAVEEGAFMTVHCGDAQISAVLTKRFADGSMLFTIPTQSTP